ncbi:hypothetical protein ACEPPN_009846 [Leptodophora sp. 'Broadleaf-Isolate-01']
MPKHKVHRNPNAWKKDIQVLTCILRLRSQPPVPYSLIASLLLQTRPSLMVRLSEKVAPRNATTEEEDMQTWLEMYLKDVYEKGEVWGSEAWKMAREWDEDSVREMVRSAGLELGGSGGEEEGKEGGSVVMDEEELELQIKWKKEGDWRAGSTPLGRPERLDDEHLRGSVTSPLPDLEDGSSQFYHAVDGEHLSDTPRLERSQRRRWRRTVGAQGQKKPTESMELASCQKDDDKADDLSTPSTSRKLEQAQNSITGEVCAKSFGYYGDQGWTEMTK